MSTERGWDATVDGMLDDLRRGYPRDASYWAQQMAFGPVLMHAIALRLRAGPLPGSDAAVLGECANLALVGFAALPDLDGGDPTALRLLAGRQARAIGWGRRGTLLRFLRHLGSPVEDAPRTVPARMLRPYPLLGFRPHERLAG